MLGPEGWQQPKCRSVERGERGRKHIRPKQVGRNLTKSWHSEIALVRWSSGRSECANPGTRWGRGCVRVAKKDGWLRALTERTWVGQRGRLGQEEEATAEENRFGGWWQARGRGEETGRRRRYP